MKKGLVVILVICLLGCLIACGGNDENSPAGKTYIYEKEGFGGGNFAITLNEDGTFHYYEGMFSSYIGTGEWEIEETVVTLYDDDYMDFSLENYFHYDGENLIFIEENSTNFSYVEVKDGEIFYVEPTATDE